jgi:hypothetical protein
MTPMPPRIWEQNSILHVCDSQQQFSSSLFGLHRAAAIQFYHLFQSKLNYQTQL